MENGIYLLIRKINPFTLIHTIPFIKNKFKESGINPSEVVNEAFKNREYGLSIIRAAGFVMVIILVFIIGLFSLVFYLLGITISIKTFFIISIIPTGLLIYFTTDKKDKYLDYFKEFDKMPKTKKLIWAIICFLVTVLSFVFGYYSFVHFGIQVIPPYKGN